jgi:hypothetical protein
MKFKYVILTVVLITTILGRDSCIYGFEYFHMERNLHFKRKYLERAYNRKNRKIINHISHWEVHLESLKKPIKFKEYKLIPQIKETLSVLGEGFYYILHLKLYRKGTITFWFYHEQYCYGKMKVNLMKSINTIKEITADKTNNTITLKLIKGIETLNKNSIPITRIKGRVKKEITKLMVVGSKLAIYRGKMYVVYQQKERIDEYLFGVYQAPKFYTYNPPDLTIYNKDDFIEFNTAEKTIIVTSQTGSITYSIIENNTADLIMTLGIFTNFKFSLLLWTDTNKPITKSFNLPIPMFSSSTQQVKGIFDALFKTSSCLDNEFRDEYTKKDNKYDMSLAFVNYKMIVKSGNQFYDMNRDVDRTNHKPLVPQSLILKIIELNHVSLTILSIVKQKFNFDFIFDKGSDCVSKLITKIKGYDCNENGILLYDLTAREYGRLSYSKTQQLSLMREREREREKE